MRTLSLLTILLGTAVAHAADLPCSPAEAGTISFDGMVDDWHDVAALQSPDGSVSLRCNTQGKTMYLAIEVTDDRVVRTAQARPGEDHVELRLGSQRWVIFPTAGPHKVKVTPGGVRVASTSTDKGFAIELALPARSYVAQERVAVRLRFDDCDAAASLKTEHSTALEGELAFTEGPSTLDTFLQDRNLSRKLVRWKKPVRIGKKSAQLVLAGKLVAAVGDGYSYVELPVADGTDVKNPQLVDLAGDGRKAVVLEYTERGEGGERTIVAAYRPTGDKVERVFAAEIGKQTSAGRLKSKVELKKHGRATDIQITALPAEGLTAESYQEAAATDVVPIVLPWGAQKKATFGFTSDGYKQR